MIAVIAGKGMLPLHACQQLIQEKKDFFVVSLFKEMYPSLSAACGHTIPIIQEDYYNVSSIKKILLAHQTKELLFIGKVDKKELFQSIRIDWLGMKLLAKASYKSDQALMEILIQELARENITVLSQKNILRTLHVPPGILVGSLTNNLKSSIYRGLAIAQQLAHLGIGQSIMMKDGIVVAVEALEGTDACISRGIDLAQSNLILCKAAAPLHNPQYDLPTLGSATIRSYRKGELAAIAWISQQTLIADLSEFISEAHNKNITLVAVDEKKIPHMLHSTSRESNFLKFS